MNQYNEQGQRYGPWEHYHHNDDKSKQLLCRTIYINDKSNGLWEWYYNNPKTKVIKFYIT